VSQRAETIPRQIATAVAPDSEKENPDNMTTQTLAGAGTHYLVAAYHEAGHAVLAVLHGRQIEHASISRALPGNGMVYSAGPVVTRPAPIPAEWGRFWSQAKKELEATIRISLAGPLAEAKLLGKPLRCLGSRGDLEKVEYLLSLAEGLDEMASPWITLPRKSTAVLRRRLCRETRRLLARPRVWHMVRALAEDLAGRGSLSGHEIEETLAWSMRAHARQFGFEFPERDAAKKTIRATLERLAA
jgi:hypothetical protein